MWLGSRCMAVSSRPNIWSGGPSPTNSWPVCGCVKRAESVIRAAIFFWKTDSHHLCQHDQDLCAGRLETGMRDRPWPSPPTRQRGRPRSVRRRSGSFFERQIQLGQQPAQMRVAEADTGGRFQPCRMLGQGGIGLGQHQRPQLRVARRRQLRGGDRSGLARSAPRPADAGPASGRSSGC